MAHVFHPPTMSGIEVSTLQYTEGATPNVLPISASVALSPGDSYVTEVRVMVTQGYRTTDLPLLTFLAPTPAIAYDSLGRGTTMYGGYVAGLLSLHRAAGFSYPDAQRLLRAFAYAPDVNATDGTLKTFVLFVAATANFSMNGDPNVTLTQTRYFQVGPLALVAAASSRLGVASVPVPSDCCGAHRTKSRMVVRDGLELVSPREGHFAVV